MPIDLAMSKYQLANILKCLTPSGQVYTYKFRKFYLTDKVITDVIGISIQAYNESKTFTPQQSKKIAHYFIAIDPELANSFSTI